MKNSLIKETTSVSILFFSIIILSICSVQAQPKAFPGAEGFGAYTEGGRGGEVIEVTNLNDSGPGSLREALEDISGPRTIIFTVSGYIKLQSRLKIKNGDVTIAGQTAPGGGICLKNYTTEIQADNVIIRFIRFRLGDEAQQAVDSFWGREHQDIIIDHCTMSWAIDECASFYDNQNFTMQWCIISESLNQSFHPSGDHGYGGIWGGVGATFHHNLFAHHTSRNPRFNGARYTTTPETELVDFANNVIYNWQSNSSYGGEAGNMNMRNNYYKYGPSTSSSKRNRIVEPYDTAGNWYINGNFIEGYPLVSQNNWNGGVQGSFAAYQLTKKRINPFEVAEITLQTPEEAFEDVLQFAGALFPERDSIDQRIVEEALEGTAHFGQDGVGIINSQTDVGGYPDIISTTPPPDSDHDGMPDSWELSNGLNPDDPADRNTIGSDGYTMLEEYLNDLVDEIIPVSVKNESDFIPESFLIHGNYPNPFNPSTTIRYQIPEDGFVYVKIYDLQSSFCGELYKGHQKQGIHEIIWNTAEITGTNFSSGLYFAVIRYNENQLVQKMLLLK